MLAQLQPKYRDKLALGISGAVLLVTFNIVRSMIRKKKSSPYKEVPTAPGWLPIFGHLFSFGKTPIFKMMDWHKKLGPLIRVDFGAQTLVLIGSAVAAQEILSGMGESTASRRTGTFSFEIYASNGRGLVIAPVGKQWKNSRMMVHSILAPKAIRQYEEAIRIEMREAAHSLGVATQKNGSVDPIKMYQLASMNIILSTCFAADRLESTDNPRFRDIVYFVDKFIDISGMLGEIGAVFPFLKWIDVITNRKRKLEALISNYRDPIIKEYIQSARASEKPNLVKSMDELKDQLDLDELDMIILLSDTLIAGADTTATTMTWMLAILVRYPDVQAKVQEEIDAFRQTHGGRLPVFEERDALQYSMAVQKECMRFRTTTSFGVLRMTTKDVIWNGFRIPKGTKLAGNMYAIHNDPDRYPDADKFIPERFSDDMKTMVASSNGRFEDRDHFNFGWGRRICPGAHLAETELFDAFVAVFSQYDVKPVLDDEGQPVYPRLQNGQIGAVVVPPEPFQIRVLPRESPLQ
ncbi:cytochrome P450 [Dichotomocladium elegans]|nr:cytochrome P450 [Dichotomocladium elegans]